MKKMINQAPIVRYTASMCEIFFSDFLKKTFSAESLFKPETFKSFQLFPLIGTTAHRRI